jgi:hypothetical protein
MTIHRAPRHGPSLLPRILDHFLRCGEFTNAHHGAATIMLAAQCRLRTGHRGDHEFVLPDGWELGT